jgi:hypothetical protein
MILSGGGEHGMKALSPWRSPLKDSAPVEDGEDKLSLGVCYEPRPIGSFGMTMFVVPIPVVILLGKHSHRSDRER